MHFQLYQLPPKKGVMHLLKKQKTKTKKALPLFVYKKKGKIGGGGEWEETPSWNPEQPNGTYIEKINIQI